MDGDFLQIANWTKANRPSWVIFVIAIIQVTEKNHITHNSVKHFMTMLPLGSGKTMVGYLWRLREAFYRTSVTQRNTYQMRSVVNDRLTTYAPSIWMEIHRIAG
jgi:hypothetical protein